MAKKLKPCLCCGGEPRRGDGPTGSYHTAFIECSRCEVGVHTSADGRRSAVATVTRRWQQRVEVAP